MTTEQNVTHGIAATALTALAIPEPWLSFGEHIVLAVIVATCSTAASKLVSLFWNKVFPK
jgi:hypothetical protein